MAKVLTSEEVEKRFGITAEQLDRWEEDATNGTLHGKSDGKVERGRPLMFGEQTRQVGFKEPLSTVEAIDKRAGQLGMRRSDYLRHLVAADLEAAGLV